MPVTLTVASLASVIIPSGLIATNESRLDSIIDRADSNACLFNCAVAVARERSFARFSKMVATMWPMLTRNGWYASNFASSSMTSCRQPNA